jgi:hypothetical protein
MAKKKGVPGWHSMRKEQLVKALLKQSKSDSKGKKRSGSKSNQSSESNGAASARSKAAQKAARTRAQKRLEKIRAKMAQAKDLALEDEQPSNGKLKDRIVVMVRDPYWLHAYWELSRQSVERARAAMGQNWHAARPVLRLSEVPQNGTTTSARVFVRDIEIHGGVSNWYIDVLEPPKSFQVDIGYVDAEGKLYALARSNVVRTPRVGTKTPVDGNWSEVADDVDRIYAMSGGARHSSGRSDLKDVLEERLRRPVGGPMTTRFGIGAGRHANGSHEFNVEVDAELVVYGATDPDAHITVKGEPLRMRPDGTFSVRFALPDRRQVLPVVASSADGTQQRTIVLAVERNTKVMEPVVREPDD